MGEEKDKHSDLGMYISIGMSLGIVFGVLYDNLALGISFGLLLGIVIHGITSHHDKTDGDD